jgi:hypothetical protein
MHLNIIKKIKKKLDKNRPELSFIRFPSVLTNNEQLNLND